MLQGLILRTRTGAPGADLEEFEGGVAQALHGLPDAGSLPHAVRHADMARHALGLLLSERGAAHMEGEGGSMQHAAEDVLGRLWAHQGHKLIPGPRAQPPGPDPHPHTCGVGLGAKGVPC